MNEQDAQAAAKAAMKAKSELEISAQRKRVQDLADEVTRRLRGLSTLTLEISAEVSALRDLETTGRTFPCGAFGKDTETIDHLLQQLAQEAQHLDGLAVAQSKAVEIADMFAEVQSAASVRAPEPQSHGQYL